MSIKLKVRRVGNSLGFIVPKELTEQLNVGEGDTIHAVRDVGGEWRLTAFDPEFDATMKAFELTRRKYRNALRELAR